MKIQKFSNAQLAVVHSNAGLSSYLTSLEKGRPATPRSWLYETEDADSVLHRWLNILESLKQGSESDVRIYEFDIKQLPKYEPQGEIPPIDEALSVESFQEQYQPGLAVTKDLAPLAEILSVKSKTLREWGLHAVVDDMSARDTLSTNSGWPAFKRRKLEYPNAIRQAESKAAYDYPAIILFRHYFGKLRAVWMYPMSMNLLEYQSTMPLQRTIQRNTQYVTPWLGFEDVKKRITLLWSKHPYAFGGDTTAMDAHMQKAQLQLVGNMSAGLFQKPANMLASLMHVADIDMIVGPNAKIANQEHGIASGSGWTQLSETIFQIGMFDRYIKDNKLNLSVEDGMGIGDDYVWFFDEQPDSDSIVSFWLSNGLPGKPEKQSNEVKEVTFLQRLFIKGLFSRDDSVVLGGVYPTIRALTTLIYPEKFHSPKDWSADMFCVRTFTILENTVDHPLFEQFVKFVVDGNTHLLEFAKMTSKKQNAASRASRLLPGLNPSYNQEKRMKPLSTFSSIQYARTL